MSDFIFQLESVMRQEVRSLDVLANNAANVATPGYRSRSLNMDMRVLTPTPVGMAVDATASDVRSGSVGSAIDVDGKDGALEVSGVASHLAIRGDGWFVVDTAEGVRMTRDGRFRVSPEGELQDRVGNVVLAEGGPLVGLKPDFLIMSDGTITLHGDKVGRLRIVTPAREPSVQPVGDGLYKSEGDLVRAESAVVVQGAYELSNVDTASDMLQLMRTVRHIETLQRSMSAYDGVIGTAINQLGK